MKAGANCSTERTDGAAGIQALWLSVVHQQLMDNVEIVGTLVRLAARRMPPHARAMFVVTDADAAAIRAAFEQRGEFAAAIELRRRFPGITDDVQARECVRTIAAWKPLPLRAVKRKRILAPS